MCEAIVEQSIKQSKEVPLAFNKFINDNPRAIIEIYCCIELTLFNTQVRSDSTARYMWVILLSTPQRLSD